MMTLENCGKLGISVLALMAMLGCDSSDSDGSARPPGSITIDWAKVGGPPVAQADFLGAYTQAVCSNIKACCSNYGIEYNDHGCATAARERLDNEYGDVSLSSNVTYDPAVAGDCVAKMAEAARLCFINDTDYTTVRGVCSKVYAGSKKPGDECASHAECGSEGICSCKTAFDSSSCTCGVSPYYSVRLPSGSSCDAQCRKDDETEYCSVLGFADVAVHGSCVKGLYCSFKTLRCTAVVPDGKPCSTSSVCVEDDYCDGTCKPLPGEGEMCRAVGTFPSRCGLGLQCRSSDNRCRTGKAVGESASDSSECGSSLARGGKCLSRQSMIRAGFCGTPSES